MLTDDEVFTVAKKIADLRTQYDNAFKAGVETETDALTAEEKQTATALSQALINRPKFRPAPGANPGAQMLRAQTGPANPSVG